MTSTLIYILSILLTSYIRIVLSSSAAGQETLIGVVGRDFIMLGADSSSSSSITITSNTIDKIKVLVDPLPVSQGYTFKGDITNKQQAIVAMIAGDSADGERLLGRLKTHATIAEYESGIGCDVECVFNGKKGESLDIFSPPGLDAESISHLARGEISSSVRSRNRLSVCMLIAGMVRSCDSDTIHEHSTEPTSSIFSSRIQTQLDIATQKYALPKPSKIKSKDSEMSSDEKYRSKETLTILKPKLFWIDEYGSIQDILYGSHGYGSNFALSILDREYQPNISREESIRLIRQCFEQLKKRYIINNPNLPIIKCVDALGCNVVQS